MAFANTLTYYDMGKITSVERFIVADLGQILYNFFLPLLTGRQNKLERLSLEGLSRLL
jgi:hypothetical protein